MAPSAQLCPSILHLILFPLKCSKLFNSFTFSIAPAHFPRLFIHSSPSHLLSAEQTAHYNNEGLGLPCSLPFHVLCLFCVIATYGCTLFFLPRITSFLLSSFIILSIIHNPDKTLRGLSWCTLITLLSFSPGLSWHTIIWSVFFTSHSALHCHSSCKALSTSIRLQSPWGHRLCLSSSASPIIPYMVSCKGSHKRLWSKELKLDFKPDKYRLISTLRN